MSEIRSRARFDELRYGMCWEDADILLSGLEVRPGDRCVSIASAGDNTLGLLLRDPAQVVALDLSPAQLAALELRVQAYRTLDHEGMLELLGARPSNQRPALYKRCRPGLGEAARRYWDARPDAVRDGIAGAGRFEHYFQVFRRRVLPLVHSHRRVDRLLAGGSRQERIRFYDREWDTWRWRLMFRLFFSRFVMGRVGRDPEFFRYVEGSVADRILTRAHHALTELEPAENPYIQWILTGRHTTALPLALRAESFEPIRDNLDRLEWRLESLEEFAAGQKPASFDRFNLSDIFEYMSPAAHEDTLRQLVRIGRPGGRLAFWNMLVERRRPDAMADRLRPLPELSQRLHEADKAFFYRAFVLEDIL